jgi:hypothetical protein
MASLRKKYMIISMRFSTRTILYIGIKLTQIEHILKHIAIPQRNTSIGAIPHRIPIGHPLILSSLDRTDDIMIDARKPHDGSNGIECESLFEIKIFG